MSDETTKLNGPDFGNGVALSSVVDGAMLLGHSQNEPVLLVRCGDELFAIGATCTHYGAPLADGLVVDDTRAMPVASRLLQSTHR